jgi:hypothetical protein
MTPQEKEQAAKEFKTRLIEDKEVQLEIDVKFIGFYKLIILMWFIRVLNIVVIPNRLFNKKIVSLNCNFTINNKEA